MLLLGEGISFDYLSMSKISPRMSQQTESSEDPSSEQTPVPPAFCTDADDASSLLDGATPVPTATDDDSLSFVPEMDFQISSTGNIYSDYYDRIREDAEWNELGQMTYVPLYGPRTSHGSFSSDRMSSEGSVSPSLPSPIGEHLKAKRDSASSLQFPIVPGLPQPFPDPQAERAREGYFAGKGKRGGGGKPFSLMEPATDYGVTTAGDEYRSSSQDSQTDVFGGSQESLNGGYGSGGVRHTAAYSAAEYGIGGGAGYRHRANNGGGSRMVGAGAAVGGPRRQHYSSSGSGYGSNGYSEYNSTSYSYEQAGIFDTWKAESFESTAKYCGPIGAQRGAHAAAAAAPPPAANGPLPTAFSRANINDEQKNNLMANLARLCNQRSY